MGDAEDVTMCVPAIDRARRAAAMLIVCAGRISTARLEGVNTKIELLKHMTYGFRDRANFELRILGIHETRLELVG